MCMWLGGELTNALSQPRTICKNWIFESGVYCIYPHPTPRDWVTVSVVHQSSGKYSHEIRSPSGFCNSGAVMLVILFRVQGCTCTPFCANCTIREDIIPWSDRSVTWMSILRSNENIFWLHDRSRAMVKWVSGWTAGNVCACMLGGWRRGGRGSAMNAKR